MMEHLRNLMLCFIFFFITKEITSVPLQAKSKIQRISEQNNSQYVRDIIRLSKSADMLNYMNESVDPCENFYKFACGKWNKINAADTLQQTSTGIFEILDKSYNRKVGEMLKAEELPNDTETDFMVKNFYKSCAKFESENEAHTRKLRKIIKEFGDMPVLSGETWNEQQFDWLQTSAKIANKYGTATILSAYVLADFKNNSVHSIYVELPDMMFETKSLYVDEINKKYRKLKTKTIKTDLMRLLDVNAALAEQTAKEIFNLEIELAQGMLDEKLGVSLEDSAVLTTVEALQRKYAPVLDMKTFLNTRFGEIINGPLYEGFESYLKNLISVLEKTPKRILANYIFYVLLDDFLIYADEDDIERENDCIESTKENFAMYLDNMLYRNLTSDAAVKKIEEKLYVLWQQLKWTFREQLLSDQYNWILNATRQTALEKLDAMQFKINSYNDVNFSVEFHELLLTGADYLENIKRIKKWRAKQALAKLHEAPTANSDDDAEDFELTSYTPTYDVTQNLISWPVAFLQPYYLYHDYYALALLYGNVGSTIAHEILHGFDSDGRKYDALGNKFDWWDENSTTVFEQRTHCFIKQYGKFRYEGHNLPETAQQEENIADNGGLRLAYAAYLKWYNAALLSGRDIPSESMPNMKYNGKQLFFISFAQASCSDVSSIIRRFMVSTDSHVPEMFRVLAPLQNFNEFSMQFNCAAGSVMNPERKCEIF